MTEDLRETAERFDAGVVQPALKAANPEPCPVDPEDFPPWGNVTGFLATYDTRKVAGYERPASPGEPFTINDFASFRVAMVRSGGRQGIRQNNGDGEDGADRIKEAVALEWDGIDLFDQGDARQGLEHFLAAQRIWRALAEHTSAIFRLDLSVSVNNVANFHGYLGEREQQLASWRELVELVRAAYRDKPNQKFALAFVLDAGGLLLKETGDLVGSMAWHREAHPLFQQLREEDDSFIPALANNVNILGCRSADLGELDDAIRYVREAAALIRPVLETDPAHNLEHWFGFMGNLGAYLATRGETRESLEVWREAVTTIERIVHSSPNADVLTVVNVLYRCAERMDGAGLHREALDFLVRAGEDCQKIIDANLDGDRKETIALSTVITHKRGAILAVMEKYKEALPLLRHAAETMRSLVEEDTGNYTAACLGYYLDLATVARMCGEAAMVSAAYTAAKAIEGICVKVWKEEFEPFVDRHFGDQRSTS